MPKVHKITQSGHTARTKTIFLMLLWKGKSKLKICWHWNPNVLATLSAWLNNLMLPKAYLSTLETFMRANQGQRLSRKFYVYITLCWFGALWLAVRFFLTNRNAQNQRSVYVHYRIRFQGSSHSGDRNIFFVTNVNKMYALKIK